MTAPRRATEVEREVEPATEPELELPRARARRRGWGISVVWIVPIVAAIVAGVLIWDRARDFGPVVTIRFDDATGLQVDQTDIKYRGVPIGQVTALELSRDASHALVRARLHRSAAAIAREGARFWIVRPELRAGNVTGLGTFISGPEVHVLPGTGKQRTEFVGLESAPAELERPGLRIVLRASRAGSLKRGTPIYYRGVAVGEVLEPQLGADAAAVDLQVFIEPRFAVLVRPGSKFWNVSGAKVHFGLFKGLDLEMDSLTSLLTGGVAFATPPDSRRGPVANGSVFVLHDGPRAEWLRWSPRIRLPAARL